MELQDRLIKYSPVYDPAVILERSGNIVLCLLPDNYATPYVTWRLNNQSPEGGHYHPTIMGAVEEFNIRTGKEDRAFGKSGTGRRAPAGSGSRGAKRQAGCG